MTELVLTAIGDDREGLVSALSEMIDLHGGNWLESGLSHLGGKFAGVVLVDVPGSRVAEFTDAAASLEQDVGLRVEVTEARRSGAGGAPAGPARPLHLHLVGQDRTGMVREITAALAELHASIEEIRTRTTEGPQGGGMLFEADAVAHVPADQDPEHVREALERIASELMVDLELDEQA